MKQLEKQYNIQIRKATNLDYRTWAYGNTLKRAATGDYVFELTQLVVNKKTITIVYILRKIKAGSNQVTGVVQEPSPALLEMIDRNPVE